MADKSIRGRFVWHELMTPDAGAAHGFYTRVLGWKTQPWEQDPSYTMFASASGPLGGTWPLETGQPRWIAYIGTDDIEATVREAQELGARVTKEITGMPNGGQYALLEDPQGAPFGVYASASSHGPQQAPKKGEYSWHELATDDFQAAFEFYSTLFGWEEVGRHEMGGPVGTYFMFGLDGVATGGIFNRMPEMPPAFWLGYVRVKDVHRMVKKVKSAGGTLLAEPMEVPGGDWIAQFADPNGAMFAVHTLAEDLKGATEETQAEEASVTPEEAGAKRHEETAAAAESGALPASSSKPPKRPSQSAAGARSTTKKAAKKAGKKSAKKAKQPAKKAAKSATKAKVSRSKPAKSKAAKSKVAKKSSKKKASTQARGAKRAAKGPARKAGKAKRSAQRRPAKKAAKKTSKKTSSKASKRARRGK